jgi:trypsin
MRPFPVLATLIAVAGCAQPAEPEPGPAVGSDQAPLLGGTLSTDPAVVALIRAGSSGSFCSGTLISPSVVLTAAHCIDMATVDETVVFFGDDIHGEGTRIAVSDSQQTGNWTDLNTGTQDFDIGLLLLQYPQDPTVPVPLNTTPATTLIGHEYRVAGFGVNDQVAQTADGKKREGTVLIDDALDPPPSSPPGDDIIIRDDTTIICFGDSGGPGFVTLDDGITYVAGVHSWTSGSNCGPPNGDTRVDLYAADFVLPYIQQYDPVCGQDGTCARIGCTDDPDCQPCGPDGTCVTDCPVPDYDCRTQEIGELCRVDSQCLSDLCVYWQGDASTHFCSQPCSGDGECPSGMSCQSIQPFGKICYYDDPPPGVTGDSCTEASQCGAYLCVDDTCTTECDLSIGKGCPADFECRASTAGDGYYCFATGGGGGGGCRAGTGGGRSAAALVLSALALVLRSRARRQRSDLRSSRV